MSVVGLDQRGFQCIADGRMRLGSGARASPPRRSTLTQIATVSEMHSQRHRHRAPARESCGALAVALGFILLKACANSGRFVSPPNRKSTFTTSSLEALFGGGQQSAAKLFLRGFALRASRSYRRRRFLVHRVSRWTEGVVIPRTDGLGREEGKIKRFT